ncbi:MAG: hypothetical protein V4568_18645 [Pseudomonadota bacterium]
MRRYLITLLAALLTIASTAWGRTLPPDGLQADLMAMENPYVQLAGKQFRLAPGARIFDTWNRIITPNMLPAKTKALYKLDFRGDVQTIWLLTNEEIALLPKKDDRKKLQTAP